MPRDAADASARAGPTVDGAGALPQIRFGGLALASHFQPIYSLRHGRLVGHEALLRASAADGSAVPPTAVFAGCADERALSDCDRLSRLVHLESFAASCRDASRAAAAEWLFLNVHPLAFQRLAQEGGAAQLRDLQRQYLIPEGGLVLEVLEAETADPARLVASIGIARDAGLLIAIDDFGAGHSNFDRVWRMRPDIVKVDRTLVARAACDASARRILRQMVSLLHECGSLVLIEGVETHAEAMVAMECDAELVQGYLFGRPAVQLQPCGHAPEALQRLPAELALARSQASGARSLRLLPFQRAMFDLAGRLSAGEASQVPVDPGHGESARFEAAARAFLALPGAESCRLLDADGRQLGVRLATPAGINALPTEAIDPMADAPGTCWAQRPVVARALEVPGQAQLSRPYRNLRAPHLSASVSIGFTVRIDGQPQRRVACGEFRWEE